MHSGNPYNCSKVTEIGLSVVNYLMKRGLLSWLLHKKERLSKYQLKFGKETLPMFQLDALSAKVKLT